MPFLHLRRNIGRMTQSLNPLEALLAVQTAGSLSGAAARLNRSASALSKLLRALERESGESLVEHASKPLRLTPAGQAYAAAGRRMRDHLREAGEQAAAQRQQVSGTLRVTTSYLIGHAVLADYVPRFRQRFPQVRVDVELDDQDPDLSSGGFDLSIRHAAVQAGPLIARPLGTNRVRLCASPAYFERHGRPASPVELKAHACLEFRCEGLDGRWRFSQGKTTQWVTPRGPVASNSDELLLASMLSGEGLLPCFDWVVGRELQQRRVLTCLDDWAFSSEAFGDAQLWAVYRQGNRGQLRITYFIDGLARHLEALSEGALAPPPMLERTMRPGG